MTLAQSLPIYCAMKILRSFIIFIFLAIMPIPLSAKRDAADTLMWVTVQIVDTLRQDTVAFRMRRVEGGSYVRGATPEQRSDEDAIDRPSHYVSVSTFYIAETEVTQRLWRAVMTDSPEAHDAAKGTLKSSTGFNPDAPAVWLSWYDAAAFCKRLSKLSGYSFYLPTEAQWEYAARGGKNMRETRFAGSHKAEEVGWVYSNSGNRVHEVARKPANELGLYDCTGNVSEWCSDWVGPYRLGEQPDPTGPETDSTGQPVGLNDWWSKEKVVRGGSWDNAGANAHLSTRGHHAPDFISNDCGMRLAMVNPFTEKNDETLPSFKNIKVGRKYIKFCFVNAEQPFYISEDAITNADWVAVFGKHNAEHLPADKTAVRGVSKSRLEVFCDRVSRANSYENMCAAGTSLTLVTASEADMRLTEQLGVKLHTPKSAPENDRQGSVSSQKRKQAKQISVVADLIGVRVEIPEDKVLETLVEDKRNTAPVYMVLRLQ